MKGYDADGIAKTEVDHFMKCPGCGEWFDMRDLGQVLAHVHDAEIEISEGPEPLQPAGSLRRSSCRSTLGARD
jgi:CRISPR/Cas system type I-B associated protein Csh2 (Cas7 group RAMP superfamily)